MNRGISSLESPFRENVQAFLEDLSAGGIRYRVTSTRRDSAEQAALFERYISGGSPVPAAPPGRSMHELGLAIDMEFATVPEWEAAAGAAPDYGFIWRRSDPVHFEAGADLIPDTPDTRSYLKEAIDFGIDIVMPWWTSVIDLASWASGTTTFWKYWRKVGLPVRPDFCLQKPEAC